MRCREIRREARSSATRSRARSTSWSTADMRVRRETAPPAAGEALAVESARRPYAEDARDDRGAERTAARPGDVPGALQGLVRGHLDVEPDRHQPAGQRRRRGRHALAARRRARVLPAAGAVYALNGLDRHLHAPAGRRAQAGRVLGADLQPGHGAAAAGARVAHPRRRDGPAGGRSSSGSADDGPRLPRSADHLPKRRPDGQPADPYELPRQRRGRTPQMHGRYPDYDVLEQAGHWDPVTREMVLGRVARGARDPLLLRRRGGHLERAVRPAHRAGLRAADPAHQLRRREVRTTASSTASSSRTCPTIETRGGWSPAGWTSRPRSGSGAASFAAADGRGAARDRRGLRRRRRSTAARGRSSTSRTRSAWSCASSWRASTPTRGRGTRSASAGRPTRAATAASAARELQHAERETWEGAEHFDRDPVSGEREPPPR